MALPLGVNVFVFRSRFPEFGVENVTDADIQVALLAAMQMVDPAVWFPADYLNGLLYWAAHFLTLKQWQLSSAELGGTGVTDLFVRSVSIGERRIMFGERRLSSSQQKMAGPGEAMLEFTIYGQMFLQLRTRNIPAVATV